MQHSVVAQENGRSAPRLPRPATQRLAAFLRSTTQISPICPRAFSLDHVGADLGAASAKGFGEFDHAHRPNNTNNFQVCHACAYYVTLQSQAQLFCNACRRASPTKTAGRFSASCAVSTSMRARDWVRSAKPLSGYLSRTHAPIAPNLSHFISTCASINHNLRHYFSARARAYRTQPESLHTIHSRAAHTQPEAVDIRRST